MSNSIHLRWLNQEKLTKKVSKRFVSYCKQDIDERSKLDDFDAELYTDAMKLVIAELEQTEKDVN